MKLKDILYFLLGFFFSGGIAILSIPVMAYLNSSVPFFVSILLIIGLGSLVFVKESKALKWGYILGFVPIVILFFLFIELQKLQ